MLGLSSLIKLRNLVLRPQFYVPVIIFSIFYCVHFWLTMVQGDTLYGGPGDHTAGLIWLYDHYPQSPWWKSTTASGYPWGDNLWSPLFLTGQIGYIFFWLLSKLLSSAVAGYNAYVAVGLMLSFGISYLFICQRILAKPFVASIVALLAVSTPAMFYAISVGHPSYVYLPAYVISVIWLAQKSFDQGSLKYPLFTGLLVGSTALFDPYFALFVPIVASVVVVIRILYNTFGVNRLSLVVLLKKAMTASVGVAVFVVPLLLLLISQSGGVNPISGAGGIRDDAYAYSAQPVDYFLPAIDNPFISQSLVEIKTSTFHGNDPTFTIFLGYSIILITIIATIWWARNYKKTTNNSRLLAVILISIAAVSFIFSLPPTIIVFGAKIYTPTWVITEFISAWRVFARFYYVVQVSLVLFLVVTAGEYLKSVRDSRKITKLTYVMIVLIAIVALFEYLPRNPLEATNFWNYQSNLPITYSRIAASNAKAIAEYPLREQPHFRGSLYLTGQHVHNKSLVNAYSPSNDKILIRLNIMDLDNPQTIPTLRFLGVDSLVVWNNKIQSWSPEKISGLRLAFEESYASKFGNDTIKTYDISKSPSSRYFGYVEKGFRPTEDLLHDIPAPLHDGAAVGSIDLCSIVNRADVCIKSPSKPARIRGTIINKSEDDVTIIIRDSNNNLIDKISVGRDPLRIDLSGESTKYTMNFEPIYNEKLFFKDVHAVRDR